jgi:hypothetical protein
MHHVAQQADIPVGAVLPYWGSLNDIPEDYELCDGGPPNKSGATLRGNKPNLAATFLRGAPRGVNDVRSNPAGRGGTDETPMFQGQTDGTSLTIAQMPSHQHEIPLTHLQEGGFWGRGDAHDRVPVSSAITNTTPQTAPFLSAPQGECKPHSHGFSVPAHTNLPTYQEIFYIIKVR